MSSFQAPITIKKALESIDIKRYLLPAIQREFVWEPSQIERLFDSVLRGYAIGSFLFWQVTAENSKEYEFYEFIKDYHELNHRHNLKADFTGKRELTAVLDGQQRLTALYIGLRGSYAGRVKWKRRASTDAYPRKFLFLNLLGPRDDDESEESETYDFRFITQKDAVRASNKHWFRVGEVLQFTRPHDVNAYLVKTRLGNEEFASRALFDLYQNVTQGQIINHYLERAQRFAADKHT